MLARYAGAIPASLLRRPRLRDPSIALLRFAALGIEIDRGRRDSPRHGDFRFAAVVLVELVMVSTVPKQNGIVDINVELSGRIRRDVGDQHFVSPDSLLGFAGEFVPPRGHRRWA